jgi:uncharacterized membrane protein YidH (DUF202 family)
MRPILADVIFPAFSTPYVSPLLFPVAGIAAIGTEWFCYRHFSSSEDYPDLGDITLANLVSWFAGIIISYFLPSGLVAKAFPGGTGTHLSSGPHFTSFAVVGFFLACILSIVIEYGSLRWSTREHQVERLFRLSAISNVAGYLVLGIVVWIWVKWIW